MSCSCRELTCASCAWQASRVVSRNILASNPKHLLSIDIGLAQRISWQQAFRNLVDYRRRPRPGYGHSPWRSLALHLWASADERLRGVISCNSAPVDIVEAFVPRWPTTMQVLRPDDLRVAVFRCIEPGVVKQVPSERGGYQAVRLSVWPKRPARGCDCIAQSWTHEALPVVVAFS